MSLCQNRRQLRSRQQRQEMLFQAVPLYIKTSEVVSSKRDRASVFPFFSLLFWQWSLRLRDGPGCIHEADVTEGLREVAQQLVTRWIYLLGEQADVIRIGNRVFEGRPGLLDLSGQCLCLSKPERAE